MNNNDRLLWDKNQASKDYNPSVNPNEPFTKFLNSYFAGVHKSEITGLRVLDVGCGCANYLAYMLEKGLDAYGFDFSYEAVIKGKRLLEERLNMPYEQINRLVVADMRDKFPFRNVQFDLIVAKGSIHNISARGDKTAFDGRNCRN